MLHPVTAFISPGGGELIMIMLVLILLFGAKDAPRILRSIQTFLDKVQRSAADFRYKLLYGDLHRNPADEEPFDVDTVYPEEDEEVQSSEEETEPGTENRERSS